MAQKKTNTERINELEQQVASLIGDRSAAKPKSTAPKSTAPKSTAAKSTAKKSTAKKASTGASTAKKSAGSGQSAKKTTGNSTAAKKSPAKKPAAKKADAANADNETAAAVADSVVEPVEPSKQPEPVAQPEIAATADAQPERAESDAPSESEVKDEPKAADEANAADAPTVADEPKAADEAATDAATPDAAAADEPAEKTEAEQSDNAPAPSEKEKGGKARAFVGKANDVVNNKGKLPIFIVANVLLVLSTVLLIVAAFNITTVSLKTVSYNLFTYFGKSAEVKRHLALMAGSWGNGGYIMIGILMILAMLVPFALAVKNLVLVLVKKDKNVHMYDAIITFAFMLAYIGIINLYGANVTAGHVSAFAIATVLVAFTTFAAFIAKSGKALPIYSIVNIPLIIVAVFLLTATPTLTGGDGPYYGARAAGVCGNGGFSFIVLLVSVFALVLLSIMQLKKLPAVLEIIVPIVSAGCALLAALLFGAGRVSGTHVGAGLICGVVFDLLLAIANVVFTLHPKLKRHKVQIKD